jgi:hypothetical protein
MKVSSFFKKDKKNVCIALGITNLNLAYIFKEASKMCFMISTYAMHGQQ